MATEKIDVPIEWISITIRWLYLMAVLFFVASESAFSLPVTLILLLGIVANILYTTIIALNRDIPGDPYLNLAIDAGVAYALFFFLDPTKSTFGWVGVLPLLTASIYFQLSGALVSTIINILIQGFIALQFVPLSSVVELSWLLLIIYLLTGFVVAAASRKVFGTTKEIMQQRHSERRQIQHAIYRLISDLTTTLDFDLIIDKVLDIGTNTLSALGIKTYKLASAVLLINFDNFGENFLQIAAAKGFGEKDALVTITGNQGLINDCFTSHESAIISNISSDKTLSKYPTIRNHQSAYCYPLRIGVHNLGIILFCNPKADYFTAEVKEVLDILGRQTEIALQNARLYQALKIEKDRIVQIQENAQKKLARSLHDGPAQSLAAIAMQINLGRRLIDRDAKKAADELYKAEDLTRQTTKEIRHMLFTLRPIELEKEGLKSALISMSEKMHNIYNQNVIINIDETVLDELDLSRETTLFYITEEAVNNARKHAQAKHIWVSLKKTDYDFGLLEIRDDGIGFDPEKIKLNYKNRGSLGMINLREQAEFIYGSLSIKSKAGKGTLVQVKFPLSEEIISRLQGR